MLTADLRGGANSAFFVGIPDASGGGFITAGAVSGYGTSLRRSEAERHIRARVPPAAPALRHLGIRRRDVIYIW